jgi:hypothetical protein
MANQLYNRHTYAAHIMGLLQRTIEIRRGFGSAVSSCYHSHIGDVVFPFLDRDRSAVRFTKLLCNRRHVDGNECDACGAVVRDASTQPLSIHVPSPVTQSEVMARINVYKAYDILSNMTNARRWRRRDPSAPLYTPADALLTQIDLGLIHLCFTWVELPAGSLEATHVRLVRERDGSVYPTPTTVSLVHDSSVSIAMGHAFTGNRKRVIDCIVPVCTFVFYVAMYCRTLTLFEYPSSAW